MTRGTKGCFVWCVDPETNEYFRQRMGRAPTFQEAPTFENKEAERPFPLRVLSADDVHPYENSVPVLDLKVAAGEFSDHQQLDEGEFSGSNCRIL